MSEQKELLSFPPLPSGTVYVNDHVGFRTEATERMISVHGVVFAHYDIGDRAAEAYTMITLWEPMSMPTTVRRSSSEAPARRTTNTTSGDSASSSAVTPRNASASTIAFLATPRSW